LLTTSVTEDEILGIGGENIAGAFACMKYCQSLDNPNNKKFVAAFKETYGDKSVIGDVTQAAYLGPWLWKLTAEKAGSFDIDKIAVASPGVEFKGAPEGYVVSTRTITCRARPASARQRWTVNMSWFMKPLTS
jgi:urea transport system substrate-binding protein